MRKPLPVGADAAQQRSALYRWHDCRGGSGQVRGLPDVRADLSIRNPARGFNPARRGGPRGAAWIDPALCQGCGTCTGECPATAIQLGQLSGRATNRRAEPARRMAAGSNLRRVKSIEDARWGV